MSSPKDLVGSRFVDLAIGEEVGVGGSAWVFRATTAGGETRALKVLRPDSPAATQQGFDAEIAVLSKVNHETIVKLHRTLEHEGLRAMELEWVGGQTLAARLQAGPIEVLEVLEIWKAASEGLATLHDMGLVHGDITPSNVMVGANSAVKLIDFGLSQDKGGVGTLPFVAPELLKSDTAVRTPKSDVFAVGACMYALLAGTFLFWKPESPPSDDECRARQASWTVIPIERLREGLASSAASLIGRALSPDPLDRPRDAAELCGLLGKAVDDAQLGKSGASIDGGFTQHLADRMFKG